MRPGRAGWLLLLAAGCANLGELTSGSSTDGSAADVAAEAQGPDGSPTDAPMQDATDADGATEAHADATTSDADATTSDEGATTPDSNPPDAPDASFTVGGTVTGLLAGQTVVLQDNGGSTLTVQGGATTFTFATTVPGGAPYSVTVLHQPAGELCTVGMGSGTASIASGAAVSVTCDEVLSLATGNAFTCALLKGGGVDCWGDNSDGQLGNGQLGVSSSTPVQTNVTDATWLTAGTTHACVVSGGAVLCWGQGSSGQLGNGGLSTAATPTAASFNGQTLVSVSAGGTHTCAVAMNGAAYCWGDNTDCDLGTGNAATCAQQNAPVAVASLVPDGGGLIAVAAIAAGGQHTCALRTNGDVVCWGSNVYGQVGNGMFGNTTPVATPTLVLHAASAISSGASHSCAVLMATDAGSAQNNLKCWGDDVAAQLGNGGASAGFGTPTAIEVTGATYTGVSCGGSSTCAATAANTLQCWGADTYGQVGNGSLSTYVTAPTEVALTGVTAVSAGLEHACAISAGAVSCWGSDSNGQLGDGFIAEAAHPVPVQGLGTAVAIGVGGGHACAVLADGGGAMCWGDDLYGNLGNSAGSRSSVPLAVGSFDAGTAIACGGYHTCGLSAGKVSCWGYGAYGQLGNGSLNEESTPTPVLELSDVTAVTAGQLHTCAALADGGVDCWGSDGFGQVGPGGASSDGGTVTSPVPVPGLGSVAIVAAGYYHTCAAANDAGVYCWGDNASGQLGIGSDAGMVEAPTRVPGLGAIGALAAGVSHTCAAVIGGGVYCWGDNSYGQLATQSIGGSSTPVLVQGLDGVKSLAATSYFTCASLSDGGVDCWGSNGYGQLGSLDAGTAPSPVAGLGSAMAVGTGTYSACALLADGGVACWGSNAVGQLGIGMVIRSSPVQVE